MVPLENIKSYLLSHCLSVFSKVNELIRIKVLSVLCGEYCSNCYKKRKKKKRILLQLNQSYLLNWFDPTGLNIGIKKFSYFLKNEKSFFYLTYLNMGTIIERVFWLNIIENWVYLWYEYCSMLFGKLRKEKKFRQYCYRNSNKKYERGKVNDVMGWGRKNLNFGNEITKILATRNSCPVAWWSAWRRSG